jgi:hypothetical protein
MNSRVLITTECHGVRVQSLIFAEDETTVVVRIVSKKEFDGDFQMIVKTEKGFVKADGNMTLSNSEVVGEGTCECDRDEGKIFGVELPKYDWPSGPFTAKLTHNDELFKLSAEKGEIEDSTYALPLEVDFKPKAAGVYHSLLSVTTSDGQTRIIKLTGDSLAGEKPKYWNNATWKDRIKSKAKGMAIDQVKEKAGGVIDDIIDAILPAPIAKGVRHLNPLG